MPQRKNFDFKSETLAPVFGTAGVLSTSTEEHKPILGAYYDRYPEYAGLYIIHVDSTIEYHDIDPSLLVPAGLSNMIAFSVDGQDYLIRELVEDDGEWLSEYGVDLPLVTLYQKVIRDAKPTIEKLIGVTFPDDIPAFEAMFVYYLEGLGTVDSLVYMSNFGIYSRIDAGWTDVDITTKTYSKLSTLEVDPKKAKKLLETFDSKDGLMSLNEAKSYAIESGVE